MISLLITGCSFVWNDFTYMLYLYAFKAHPRAGGRTAFGALETPEKHRVFGAPSFGALETPRKHRAFGAPLFGALATKA